jgi:hypothetical protein
VGNWKLRGSGLVWDPSSAPTPAPTAPPVEVEKVVEFDPGAHTIDEVKAYVTDHPDDAQRVRAAELEGKARAKLLAWLTGD